MTVNGYYCRNCADADLAKRHLDPTKPNREDIGGKADSRLSIERDDARGVNRATGGGTLGRRLDVRA